VVTVDDGELAEERRVDSVWSTEDLANKRVDDLDEEGRVGEVHAADLDVAPEPEGGEDEGDE